MTKDNNYTLLLSGVSIIINEARNASVRAINSIMTATYWEIGRMIVENEQKGKKRAGYGEKIIKGLSKDLTDCFGKGFSARNLRQMRQFYISKPIWQTPSAKLKESTKQQTLSAKSVSMKSSTPSNKLPTPVNSQTLSYKLTLEDIE